MHSDPAQFGMIRDVRLVSLKPEVESDDGDE